MRISLKKSGMLKLGLSLVAMTVAASVQAKTLVYCSEGSPEGFNPQLFTSGTTYDASSVPLYNRLVEFKIGTTEVIPGLAEKWEVSEDGKTYTFHLRKGVKWHDNKEFKPTRELNADDVVFSFDRQKNAQNPYHKVSGGSYEYFEGMGLPELISEVKKVDDNTVQFVLTRPEAPFLADLAMDFASILSKEYADAMMKAGTPEKLDLNPIGTGPFQLQQYQKDSRIRYKAFDGYWGTKPQIDTLVFSITPDASVRYAKLQKNECQVMPYPNPADIARMKQDKSINLMEMPGLNVGYLSYNVQKKPLDDVKVRQALTYAVNKDAIIKAVYQGAGVSAKNLIPPTMWGYNDDVQDYTYDPEKAKALLKEAGLEKGFSIDLWAMPVQRPYNPNARRMAEMIQADWAKVGVQAKIVTYEWGEYLKRAKDGEHQTVMMGWTGDNGDPDNFFATLFSCAASEQGSNYSKWCYKPFEDLIQPARATDDHNKRVELYKQAQVVMHDQAPALIIAHSTVFEPVRKEVKGYVVDPLGKHHFENVSIVSIDLWAMPVQRPYNPNARRMAEMIQADWAKVGVQAKIVTYEWGEYLKRAKDGEHQTVMMGWTGDNGDPDNFFATLFSCAASEQGSNYSKWCYKPFEDLIQPARATDDHNKRVELYKQAQVVMHDQAPALIIAHSTVFEPVRKEVKGYVVDPLGKHHFENVSIE